MMEDWFSTFSLARIYWLLAIIPAALLLYLILTRLRSAEIWSQHIAPEFLKHLTDTQNTQSKPLAFGLLSGLFVLLVIFALSGPSFETQDSESIQTDDTLVIIMDMSLSMLAQDVQPSRAQRVKFKIEDILKERQTGFTSLIVYSGDAHTVVPLTSDTDTIQHLLKSLDPWMIPSKGSRLSRAMEEANKLLEAYPSANSRILLFTDEVSAYQLEKTLEVTRYPTYVVGVGTSAGAPIPLPDKRLLKDKRQNIVIAKFEPQQAQALAHKSGGSFNLLSVDNSDILPALDFKPAEQQSSEALDQLMSTKDYGYLLLIPAVILLLMSFRKGWILVLPFILLQPEASFASESFADKLWKNQQQRAQEAYNEGDFEGAAKLFTDPLRKGNAYAKNKDYLEAEEQFSKDKSAISQYNLANVQAQQNKLEEAKASYQEAIKQAKKEGNQQVIDQASKDLDTLEKLEEQQQEQQNQQGDGQNSDQDSQQDSDQNSQQDSDQNQQGDQQDQGDQSNQQDKSQQGDSENNASGQENADQQNQSGQSDDSQQDQDSKDAQSQGSQANEREQMNEEEAQQAASQANQSDEQLEQEADSPASSAEMNAEGAEENPSEQALDQASSGSSYEMKSGEMNAQEVTEQEIQEQEFQKALRKIEADPSILLQNKFKIQHYQRNQPENEAQVW